MTATSKGETPPQKRTRTATVTYPYHPLELCVKLAEAIKEIGNGRQEVDRSVLAAHLKLDEQSTDFSSKLASTKTYGIIDGKSAFVLTETAKGYFFPMDDPDKARAAALLKFFSSPGAFRILIDAHDGSRPPSTEIMGNVLSQKFGIPESWKTRVAAFFLRAGSTAGAITPDGFLRYKARLQSLGIDGEPIQSATGNNGSGSVDANQRQAQSKLSEPEQAGVIVWKYPFQGKMLRVETPENLTEEIWEKLNRYIQVLKP